MHMVDRLSDFVVPYQHALETEAGQRNMHLYLQGLLSHLPGKNAEDIATFVEVERQVMQACIGTAPWDYRPLITVNWLRVFRRVDATLLGLERRRPHQTRAVREEKCVGL
jgi:hypothetical protein